jgi:hypothetical protein
MQGCRYLNSTTKTVLGVGEGRMAEVRQVRQGTCVQNNGFVVICRGRGLGRSQESRIVSFELSQDEELE